MRIPTQMFKIITACLCSQSIMIPPITWRRENSVRYSVHRKPGLP